MGLHSLTPRAPEWDKDPWDHYRNNVARIRSYVETHYEFERPTYGYIKGGHIAAKLFADLEAGLEEAAAEQDRELMTLLQAALWDATALEQALMAFAPRADVVRILADLRRTLTRIDDHAKAPGGK